MVLSVVSGNVGSRTTATAENSGSDSMEHMEHMEHTITDLQTSFNIDAERNISVSNSPFCISYMPMKTRVSSSKRNEIL